MKLIFVHGWSVTDTGTYAQLPEALAADAPFPLEIEHIHLGRYISFHDEVSMEDVVRALDRSLRDTLGGGDAGALPEFSCVTHSTGGPIMREWAQHFYGPDRFDQLPLRHLVMLAPANHGSALAALGKKRVGRIKAWFQGVEPGQRILDWLSLGSDDQWRLNARSINRHGAASGYYPFVLAGQTIDHHFYDFLNSYLVEKGTDGVIRVAGANLNYSRLTLVQTAERLSEEPETYALKLRGRIKRPQPVPLGILPDASHSGSDIGIMNSVTLENRHEKPVVGEILKCLSVESVDGYNDRFGDLRDLSEDTQAGGARYMMIVFQVQDDRGETIHDYDLLLLAGTEYDPAKLKTGFFMDRQYNARSGRLVYYVDAGKMRALDAIGFRITARPSEGFSYYAAAEYRSGTLPVADIVRENETLYVRVILKRRVARNVFVLDPVSSKPLDFKKEKPSADLIG